MKRRAVTSDQSSFLLYRLRKTGKNQLMSGIAAAYKVLQQAIRHPRYRETVCWRPEQEPRHHLEDNEHDQ